MKRSFLGIFVMTIVFIIVMPLLLTSCSGVPVVELTAENVVLNTGFEEPTVNGSSLPDNWTSAGTSLGRSTDAYAGNYSAYIYGADSSYTQTVRIKAVALYRFAGYIKSSESTATMNLTVLDSDGEPVESELLWMTESLALKLSPNVTLSTNQTVWEKDMVYFYSPETAYDAVIKLAMTPDGNASSPEAWYDDVLLEEKYECFIATAAYGTPLAEEIEVLRQVRDEYLQTNPAGRLLNSLYYTYSPPLADYISKHEGLRAITRMALEPITWLCSRITVPPSP
jgi:hypothetical protein